MNYRNMIDDYLTGSISSSEREAFEQQLARDSQLRSEYELQRHIVDQIRETRKLELKSRLDHINIHWYHTIPGSYKIAAAISLLTVSTLSAFYYIDQQDNQFSGVDLSETHQIDMNQETEMVPEKPAVNILDEAATAESDVIETKATESPAGEEQQAMVDEPVTETPSGDTDSWEETRQVDVFVPDMKEDEFAGNNELDMTEATADDLGNIQTLGMDRSGKPGVQIIDHRKYNFHYQLSEGTLTLYGDFEGIPYEILEIISAQGKRFYLKYQDHYYPLKVQSKVNELRPVTDDKILNELKIVEENK